MFIYVYTGIDEMNVRNRVTRITILKKVANV